MRSLGGFDESHLFGCALTAMARVPNVPLRQSTRLERPATDNVRYDLSSLSDLALQDRLDEAWRNYENSKRRMGWSFNLLAGLRSPVRDRRLDRFAAMVPSFGGDPRNIVFGLVVGWLLSAKAHEKFLRWSPDFDMHLSLCEIQDINDEMKHRALQRKGMKT